MKHFLLRANWKDQEDSVWVIIVAESLQEAIKKGEAKYEGFYWLVSREVHDVIH